ncbi:MAG: hypothetical protein V3V33_09995 [Candidatus Lokiarchaeia archaeon]
MNQAEMNVFVTTLEGIDWIIRGSNGIDPLVLAMVVILPLSAGTVVILVVFIKRRK